MEPRWNHGSANGRPSPRSETKGLLSAKDSDCHCCVMMRSIWMVDALIRCFLLVRAAAAYLAHSLTAPPASSSSSSTVQFISTVGRLLLLPLRVGKRYISSSSSSIMSTSSSIGTHIHPHTITPAPNSSLCHSHLAVQASTTAPTPHRRLLFPLHLTPITFFPPQQRLVVALSFSSFELEPCDAAADD